MAHITIIINGIAYYPGHENGEVGKERKQPALPEITEWVELPASSEEALTKTVEKAIDKALEKDE